MGLAAELRRDALDAWREGVRAASPVSAVERAVASRPGFLAHPGRTLVVATGKAAPGMLRGYGPTARGICIAPEGADLAGVAPSIHAHIGGHPIPTHEGLSASRRVLAAVEALTETQRLVYLVSGGSSSLFEVPREEIPDEDLIDAYAAILAAGMTIHDMNCLRRALSVTKGGGLARAAGGAEVVTFAVSDVPGDVAGDIGSGPTVLGTDPPGQALALAKRHDLLGALPASVRRRLQTAALEPPPATLPPTDAPPSFEIVVSVTSSTDAAEDRLVDLGYDLCEPPIASLEGEATAAAWTLVEGIQRIRGGLAAGRRAAFVVGGETTLRIAGAHGRGGRSQHAACVIAGALTATAGFACMIGGTDGRDGSGEAAGALVDGGTAVRAAEAGRDLRTALERFDSEPALRAAGDAVVTGSTGTNVGDLVVVTMAGGGAK
jgi:glycerate 2-kinase